MAEVAKYHLLSASNGGSLLADLKRPFSIFKARRRKALLSGFFIVFVSFTLLLAFTPPYFSFSPWFHTVFSGFSTANFSSSDGSVLPTVSSYSLSNSPPQITPINHSPPRSPQTPTLPAPVTNKSAPLPAKQQSSTKVGPTSKVVNQTVISGKSLNPTAPSNFTGNSVGVPIIPPNTVTEKSVKSNLTASLSKKKPEDGGGGSGSSVGGQSNTTVTAPAAVPTPAKQVKKGDWLRSLVGCDLYNGEWVRDDSYPLYKPGSCGLIDEQFRCFVNGRPDNDYFKYKWKPKGCNLPRLDGVHLLKLLRGKRLVFVGDSLNRNMWESMICILKNSVKDQRRVFESHGKHHFRNEAVYSFVFKDYNFTVEFFVSPFLVRQWEMKEKDGKAKETLRIDLVGESFSKFTTADILVFNTGHWWTHWKTSSGKDYYQEGNHVYPELGVAEAFRRSMTTWARWVDANVDQSKTQVLFRGYSHSHFSGGQWNSGGACDNETEPITNATYLRGYPWKGKVLESVLNKMKTPVSYINITTLTDYRKDAHPSIYRKPNVPEEERRSPMKYQDCSHWCLPGVPDAWNELLYGEMLIRQYKQLQQRNQKKPSKA